MLLDELSRAGRYAAHAWESRPAPVGRNQFNLPRELVLDSQQLVEDQNLAHDAFLVNLFSVAALTWVLYDMTLNVDREISLVWKRWHEKRGRHSRRLYILVRYFSVINLAWYIGVNTSFGLSRNVCGAWYYIVLVNTSIITLLPDIMLLIRVNAVYNWDMRTLLFSIFLFIIQMTTSLVAGTLAVDSSTRFIPTGVIPGCQILLNKPIARFTLVAWIPSILIQFTYFLLIVNTLANLLHGLKQAQAKSQPSTTWLPDHTAPAPSNMPLKPITKSEPSPTSNQVDCDLDLNKALQATDTVNAEKNTETPAVTDEGEIAKVASIPFPSSSASPPIAFDTSTPGASSSKLPPRTRSISYQSQDMSFNTLRSTRTIQSSINDSSMRDLIQPSRSRAYSQSATEQSYLSSQSDIPLPSHQNQSEQSFRLHRLQSLPIPEPSHGGQAAEDWPVNMS
ncbi:hypothetical protein D9613_009151 [Agrocybe pediades]|uniref:DUF6533 domain-containing protein n=1 Tax=Agrocybe pediades TaxID=84607 RepID=A0A8H4R4G9_9AGAR|nr:hypothetical protein D9613_009151 [Agrocybe pediades]